MNESNGNRNGGETSSNQILSADPKIRAVTPARRAEAREGTTELAGEAGPGAGASACAAAVRAVAARTTATRADWVDLESAIVREGIGRRRTKC